MKAEDDQGTEQTVEADAEDSELEPAVDVADDDVEAHVWRAQS